jgi:hypothetical protein
MRGFYLRSVREKDGAFRRMSPNTEGLLWVLVVSKRVGRSRIATFHAPKPFNIIGECERADL